MTRTLIFDGDVYAYQAAAGVEKAVNWGDGDDDDSCLWTLHADGNEACSAAVDAIESLVDFIGGDKVVVALSHKDNWRKTVLPTYKANRAKTRRPLALAHVREFLRENYEVYERPSLEADDILGILLTAKGILPRGERICITIDKDLKTVPGLHLNSGHRTDGIFEVDEAEADRWHLYQSLIGDTVDGYTGCPGLGPVAANAFLDDPYVLTPVTRTVAKGKRKGEEVTRWEKAPTDDVWAGIVSLYAKAGYSPDYALQQARVARILRASDYDFKKKEPILWTPN